MRNVKVLGTGCANCKATVKLIEDAARAKGVAVNLEKVENIADIMAYGVMSTPGVVIDGKVVHAGGMPTRAKIEQWLAGDAASQEAVAGRCCGSESSTIDLEWETRVVVRTNTGVSKRSLSSKASFI